MYQPLEADQPVRHERDVKPRTTATSIGWILQGGVMLSATLIGLGLLLLPSRPGGLSPQRVLAFPQTSSQIIAGLLVLRPQAIITLGLLLLIATPILRVAASIVAFAMVLHGWGIA